jgi:serine/threonine protein kinase
VESLSNNSDPDNNLTAMKILCGIFRADLKVKDQRCILKLALNEDQQKKIECEKRNLELIISRDPHLERQRYVANWLYPSALLEQDQIHFLNETGDHITPSSFSFSSSSPSWRGLVFECGGLNLKEFMKNQNYLSVPVTQRVQILHEIIEAVRFLHNLEIVHFDLKPENIVSFSSSHDHKTKWKLIDFDSSHDEKTEHSLLAFLSKNSESNLWLTESYAAPEIAKVLVTQDPNLDVAINWRMDIWSLGLITFFLFSDHSFWSQYSSSSTFSGWSMVSALRQQEIDFILSKLSRQFGLKERSMIESCLQVDPACRQPTTELLKKSLFETRESTVHANALKGNTNLLLAKIEEIQIALKGCPDRAHALVTEELTSKFQDFYYCITTQIDRLQNE